MADGLRKLVARLEIPGLKESLEQMDRLRQRADEIRSNLSQDFRDAANRRRANTAALGSLDPGTPDAEFGTLSRREAITRRAKALRQRGFFGKQAFGANQDYKDTFGSLNYIRERTESVGRLVRGGFRGVSGLGTLPGLANIAPFAALAAPIFALLLPMLEKWEAARLKQLEALMEARIQEAVFQASFQRKLTEDVEFLRAETAKEYDHARMLEASLGKRIDTRTARISLEGYNL